MVLPFLAAAGIGASLLSGKKKDKKGGKGKLKALNGGGKNIEKFKLRKKRKKRIKRQKRQARQEKQSKILQNKGLNRQNHMH